MTIPADGRLQARNDLAWAIAVGGIGIVGFAALLTFAWYFSATLFLIFAGMLLGVALNAMTKQLGRIVALPHALRLTIVCLVLAGFLSGVVFLGGSTIAQQATVLSDTIKSQLVVVKAFLEKNGITPAISTSARRRRRRSRHPPWLRPERRRLARFRARGRSRPVVAPSSARP